MRRITLFRLLVILACLISSSWTGWSRETGAPTHQNVFVPDCSPPFLNATARHVDVSSVVEGVFEDNGTGAHRAQNRVRLMICLRR